MSFSTLLSLATYEELATLRLAFQIYDRDGIGSISLPLFAKVIQSLQIASDPEKIQSIVRSVDCNGDSVIDFNEFVHAMIEYLPPAPVGHEPIAKGPSPREKWTVGVDHDEVVQCFAAFDKNNDGKISQGELECVLMELGEALLPDEIKEMMEEADQNSDGFIDFEEFKQLVPPS